MKPEEPFKIVEADASHVPFLSSFGRASFIDAYKCTLPEEELKKYTDVAFSKSTILDEIEGTSATYFIYRDSKSNLCGYSKLLRSTPPKCINSDRCIELQRLYVDENHRAQGIGKLLSLHGEEHARSRGIRSIWLRVWEGNDLAQKKYIKWNYSVVGSEHYQVGGDGRTVVLMCKRLSSG